jgi:hypothetical protein
MSALARVSGAHTGVFSQERVYIQRLSSVETQAGARIKLKPRIRRRILLRRVIPLSVLFLSLLFQLFVRVQIIHAGYAVSEKRQNALAHDRELRELRSHLAQVTSPKILLARAEKELGLFVTPPQRLRTVSHHSVDRGPARGRPGR